MACVVVLASHDRACCAGVDGEIAPDLLPFATVRFVNAAAPTSMPAPAPPRTLAFERDAEIGMFVRQRTAGGTVLAMLTLRYGSTLATAARAIRWWSC